MSKTMSAELIEQLAIRIMDVDPGDPSGLTEVLRSLTDLGTSLGGTCEKASSLIDEAVALLPTLVAGRSSDLEADFATVSRAVSALQDVLTTGADGYAGTRDRSGNDSEARCYVMPEWVDEATLGEFLEAQRHALADLEADIMGMEESPDHAMGSLRRQLHTLKGEAGVLGLDALEQVCHTVEGYLDLPLEAAIRMDHLLLVKDWVAKALDDYAQSLLPRVTGAEMAQTIHSWMSECAVESMLPALEPGNGLADSMAAKAQTESVPHTGSKAAVAQCGNQSAEVVERDEDCVEMLGEFLQEASESLSQADEILLHLESEGADPERVDALFRVFHTIKGVASFMDLDDITTLAHTTETLLDQVRSGNRAIQGSVIDRIFDATQLMRKIVERVRLAVENQCVIAPSPELANLIELLEQAIRGGTVEAEPASEVAPDTPLGAVLSSIAQVPEEVVETALRHQTETGLKLGEQLIADGNAEPRQVGKALRAQREAKAKSKIMETVKVELARVDSMVTLIGELAIVESMVVNDPYIAGNAPAVLRKHLVQLSGIARDLQNEGLRMRMVPVRGVFQKMARMVRDLSRKSGKQVRLLLSGEGSEMDRSMVERIADPLVHMIRNSVDHGIEPPKDRCTAGKPEQGLVKLSAYHQGGNIVIEISDDGRGLDRDAIERKACERNLITDSDQLSDSEIYELIFAPGFSTADKVTEISGRGVGMDVVKRNIEAMRGRVLIRSELGQGTTFKIVLPLTLAIIDGTIIACGSERYIIPTLSIVESVKPTADALFQVADRGEVLSLRDEILPLLHLDRLFNVADAQTAVTESLAIIIESRDRHIGLLIDDVVGRQQVVIKSLGSEFADVDAVSGAAILADGNVGLILDVDVLTRLMSMVPPREPAEIGYPPRPGQAAAA